VRTGDTDGSSQVLQRRGADDLAARAEDEPAAGSRGVDAGTRGALDVKEILDEETYQKKPVADAI